jgi:predicted GIY-YIG superfamily endonuclease
MENNSEITMKSDNVELVNVSQFYDSKTLICEYPKCRRGERKFQCENHLIQHIKSVHFKEKRYFCTKCTTGFWRKSSLIQHVIRAHDTQKRKRNTVNNDNICEFCKSVFACKNNLKRHLAFYCKANFKNGTPKIECKICKRLYSISGYKKHAKMFCTSQNIIHGYKMNDKEKEHVNSTVHSLFTSLMTVDTFDVLEKLKVSGNIGVYALICGGCKTLYIGSTSNLQDRQTFHKSDMKSGCNPTFVAHGLICTVWTLSSAILLHREENPNLYREIEVRLLELLGKENRIMNLKFIK